MKKLEEKQRELQQLVAQYNQINQTLQETERQILKVQGAIDVLQELAKEENGKDK